MTTPAHVALLGTSISPWSRTSESALSANTNPLLHLLGSPLGLLVVGFILTTVAGSIISSRLQATSWKRQTRLDLFRKRYEEGIQFLEQFSCAIGNRFFYLQRLLWAHEDVQDTRIAEIESEYFNTVHAWNSTYWMYRNKIRLLVGDERANAFLDYRDDYRLEHPESLHYKFVKAHRYVRKARSNEIGIKQAQSVVDDLNWACSAFLETLTTAFLEKATSLQLLELPARDESSLSQAVRERGRIPIPPRLWTYSPDGTSVLAATAADVGLDETARAKSDQTSGGQSAVTQP